jgi:hypothetical protein
LEDIPSGNTKEGVLWYVKKVLSADLEKPLANTANGENAYPIRLKGFSGCSGKYRSFQSREQGREQRL